MIMQAEKGSERSRSEQDAALYHGTSIIGFCHIARSNTLAAAGGEGQASFSLSREIGERFTGSAIDLCKRGQLAQFSDFWPLYEAGEEDFTGLVAPQAEMHAGGAGVVLVFDREALHRDHRFYAVNFECDDLETMDCGYCGDELEECVFDDVAGLDRYVTGIVIDPEAFARYCDFVREALPGDTEAEALLAAGEAWVERFPDLEPALPEDDAAPSL